MDNTLEAKLNAKLQSSYRVELQPLFVFRDKINCVKTISIQIEYTCYFMTKALSTRKKIIWKLFLFPQNSVALKVNKANEIRPANASRIISNSPTNKTAYQTQGLTSQIYDKNILFSY